MFCFSFLSSPKKDQPVLIPITEDEVKKNFRFALSALTKKQQSAVQTALKNNVPQDGFLPVNSGDPLVIILLMKSKKKLSTRDCREAGQQVFAGVSKWQIKHLCVAEGSLEKENLTAFREGVVLGSYEYNNWKGILFEKKQKKNVALESISFLGSKPAGEQNRLQILAQSVAITKDLINCPPAEANPSYLEKTTRKIAKKLPKTSVTVIGQKQLKQLGLNGILAVGEGSHEDSRMIIIKYSGDSKNKKPILLVGKGVTYDTGGYSIKPSQYMENMKQDLGGASTVLGAFYAIATSGIKKNVIAVMPAVENSINSHAFRPDDVIKMFNGVTVEVTNTDAEGRILLGDAIAYAAKKFEPSFIIDLATLTGACAYAVGNDFTAILGTDKKLIDTIIKTGEEVDEPIWQLPLHERYKEELKSPIADIVNNSKMRAGTIEGALFIQYFVPKNTSWCHLDIASVAFDDKKKMATGRNVRLLLELVKKL